MSPSVVSLTVGYPRFSTIMPMPKVTVGKGLWLKTFKQVYAYEQWVYEIEHMKKSNQMRDECGNQKASRANVSLSVATFPPF
ncbi:MAG: hypothetical protein ABIN25_10970, partial [Ginsengibacter sp.]